MAINDKLSRASNGTTAPVPTTLASPKANGATTASLLLATGWSTTTPVHFKIYSVSVTGSLVAGTETVWKATLSGTTLSNMQLQSGTEPVSGYAFGSVVEPMYTHKQHDDTYEAMALEHGVDGTHALTSAATITGSKLITSLNDTNGNELFKVSPTASAVNEFTLQNAAASSAPQLQATGNDTNIAVNLVPKGTGAVQKAGNPIDWWEEIGRTTLGTAGDTISVTGLPARNYLRIIAQLPNSGQLQVGIRFNNDSGSNYAVRRSGNGAADATGVSASNIDVFGAQTSQQYLFAELANVAGQEKIVRFEIITNQTAGAANNPDRGEGAGKWANTSNQVTRVDIINTGTGDFAIGSEVVVLGHN